MNCAEARERILASSIDDEVAAHIASCEACSELAASDARLARALGLPPEPDDPPEGQFEKITSITGDQDAEAIWRLRYVPTNRRIVIAIASALVGGIVYFLAWRRPDWGVYPMMRMGLLLGAMFIATVFGVVMSMPRDYKPERPRTVRLGLFALLLAIPFIPAILPVAHHAHEASIIAGSFWVAAAKCIGLGTLAAFPALLTIRLLQRDEKLNLWSTSYAALAAAVGANIALQVHCPIVSPLHIALAHGILGVLYAVLAWAVVKATVR